MSFATVAEALRDFRRGKPLVVVDDPGRENEGDVVVAA
ncbi:MAG TPA: 3,4-dihydroxy-2-butanone-4-phosphate synthase, partial [Elusimicrobiota bacterium]|nr:3,4-dihydroxy-2-butanone-4-phosphate synthase [Elusimicrobiota bacterium]